MKTIRGCIVLFVLTFYVSTRVQCAVPPPTLLESYTSLPPGLQNIGKIQQAHLNSLWNGAGCILAGRVVLENGDHILSSRASLLADGSFCVRVYPGRELVMYAHGYEPLVLTPPAYTNYPIAYFGDITMTRLPDAELASVRGVIGTGTDAPTPGESTTLRLELDQPPPIWGNWGSEGNSIGFSPIAAERTVGPGAFEFKGLSPSPYRLLVSRSGHIVQVFPFNPGRGEVVDLGAIVLQKARVLTFRYISRTRSGDGNWIEQATVATNTVTCDGRSPFHYTDVKDGLGNRLDLYLPTKDRDVQATFFFAPGINSFFYDLGPGTVESLGNFTSVENLVAGASAQPHVTLRAGNRYLFRARNISRTDIDVLFQVTEK